jgi:hypothetical protein
MSHMTDINVYGVISISFFFVFFAGMLQRAACRKKSYLQQMSALPLDGGVLEKKSNQNTLH